jgi:hypothetical protein
METIRISTQYYENYSHGSNSPHWKPKGTFEFMIKADADLIFYATDLKEILSNMVTAQSNDHEKFEYIDHEISFTEPFLLSTEEFENNVRNQFEAA